MNTKTLILSSGKCSWAQCFACGWGKLSSPVDVEKLKQRVESLDLSGVDKLKVFVSGSFLDDAQFPREFRKWFAEYVKSKGVKELVIESRPEFITDENLKDFEGIRVTVSIGLECADDEALKKYRKGFTVADYLKAVDVIHKHGFKVRTYLMVNMPFSNNELLDKSVKFAEKHSDEIVLINTFPHSKSQLFDYWIQGMWKPLSTEEFEKLVAKYKSEKIETDSQNYLFVPKFPSERRVMIRGATIEALTHPHFCVWQDYFQRFYKKPEEKKIALFLPCSFKKPYSRSHTHKKIHEVLSKFPELYKKIHKIVVSTPGVVPFEFSSHYPFNSYDWPEWEETEEVKQAYIKVNKERVKKYLQNHKYEKYYAYLKPTSETWKAVKQACEELGIGITNLADVPEFEQVKEEKNPLIQTLMLKAFENKLKELSEHA